MIINSQAMALLKEFFIIDKVFDLLEYDHNMHKLYAELKELKKEQYAPTYRFIFLHYDTEYYVSHSVPGLTLTNLQRILITLDIPNYFCIVLSQQPLQEYLDWLRENETNDSCSITCIANYLYTPIHQAINQDLSSNCNLITKKYISLNRVKRFHRKVLISLLAEKNLLEQGIVSYG